MTQFVFLPEFDQDTMYTLENVNLLTNDANRFLANLYSQWDNIWGVTKGYVVFGSHKKQLLILDKKIISKDLW